MQRIVVTPENHSDVVQKAVTTLQAGGLVLFPTETTYGAGVDACSQLAVKKLLAYKSRREGKPLSIAVTDLAMAEKYVEVNEQAKTLYHQFLPGPVTIVSKGRGKVAPGVESEFGTLGVRIPDYPLVLAIVKALGRPITATSANASGEKRPYSINDVLTRVSGKQLALIDLVIDAGLLPTRPPSTVIDTTLSTPITLRQGEISVQHALNDQLPTTTTNSGQTLFSFANRRPSTLPTTDSGQSFPDVANNQRADSIKLVSRSETETKQIAGKLLLKHWDDLRTRPILIALDGPLGAGKTVFAKGIAEFLGLTESITSPTYTYIEEYDFTRHQTKGKLYHLDMWKLDSAAQFERLEFASLLKPGSVIIVEWWEQVEAFVQPQTNSSTTTFIGIQIADIPDADTVRQLSLTIPKL